MEQVAFKEHILTPQTERNLFGGELTGPLLRGENISIFSLPHGGIREKMGYLIRKIDNFAPGLGKSIFVYLDPNDLAGNNPEECFRLMAFMIDKKEIAHTNALLGLKEKINLYLDQGYRLIFIFGYFYKLNYAPSFFNNLVSLNQLSRRKISFIFTSSRNILVPSVLAKYAQLRELMLENVVYFPVFSKEDGFWVLRNLSERFNYQVNEKQAKEILAYVGGHPMLILQSLRIVSQYPGFEVIRLGQRPEINIILENIWFSFSAEEKNLIRQILDQRVLAGEACFNHLLRLGVVVREQPLRLFSPLLENYLRSKPASSSLAVSPRQILVNGLPPKEKITARDYKLLTIFVRKPGQIISRDEMAQALWGGESYDKYSDWAIDRAIHGLRRKLQKWGIPTDSLQTAKGLGYRWVG